MLNFYHFSENFKFTGHDKSAQMNDSITIMIYKINSYVHVDFVLCDGNDIYNAVPL